MNSYIYNLSEASIYSHNFNIIKIICRVTCWLYSLVKDCDI